MKQKVEEKSTKTDDHSKERL